MIAARDESPLKTAAAEIGVEHVVADVGEEADVERMVQTAIKRLDGLNVVVNNAAYGYFAPLHEIDTEDFEALFRTNVIGAMMVGRECARHFISQGFGNIINISSTAGRAGFAEGSAYAGSKFAMRGMTECWRAELRKHNIRVMLVNPSEVQTDFAGRPGRERGKLNPTKLVASDIAAAVTSILSLDDHAFVPEVTVWATNPQNQ